MPTSAPRSVLIIEDDPVFADVLVQVARRSSLAAQVADRGDDGIAMARQLAPSVITLDLRMPGLDGWVVLDRLRHDPTTRQIPVCVVAGDERRHRALQLGAFGYVQKPVTLEELAARLEHAAAFAARRERTVLLFDADSTRRASFASELGVEDVVVVDSVAGMLGDARPDCVVIERPPSGDSLTDVITELAARPWAEDMPVLVLGRPDPREESRLQRLAAPAFVQVVASGDELHDEVAARLHRARPGARRLDRRLSGRRVLVVDDDPRNILATAALLESKGVEVTSATGGRAALDILEEGTTFDLILTDIMMPGLDGYEVIRAIRSMPALGSVPVLALTAKAMRGDRDRCLAAGATDYVPKPVDPDQLLAAMRVCLTD